MVRKSLAIVGNFNPNRCFLCNNFTFQSDDFALVENRNLATLKISQYDEKNYHVKIAKMIPTIN